MSSGEIKCCGSPHFLKNEFGLGYRIRLTKGDRFDEAHFMRLVESYTTNNNDNNNSLAENLAQSSTNAIENKRVQIETNVAGEICLAVSNKHASILVSLLTDIERSKQSLDIDGYSISSSTIEEIFLRIEHRLNGSENSNNNNNSTNESEKSSLKSEGTSSLTSSNANKSESILSLIVDNGKKSRADEYKHDLSNGNYFYLYKFIIQVTTVYNSIR
jgi:hypothetical protein